jgi:hypothetical protein
MNKPFLTSQTRADSCVQFYRYVNYDALTKRFYNQDDQRYQDAGRINLPPPKKRMCKEADKKQLKFRKVRYELGTPFTNVCTVDVSVVDAGDGTARKKLNVKGGSCHVQAHQDFVNWILEVFEQIRELNPAEEADALTFQDLETLAGMFKREQTMVERRDYIRYPNDSEWTDVSNDQEGNPYESVIKGLSQGG